MITAHDIDIGWSETSFGDNTPSFNVQPISDGEGSAVVDCWLAFKSYFGIVLAEYEISVHY